MNMLTHDSIQKSLNREIAEVILIIAKLAVTGKSPEMIADALGSTRVEVEEIIESQDYKDVRLLVGFEHAKIQTGKDFSWDGIEHTALEGLAKRVGLERDTDTLLRIAAVANKAVRRQSQTQEHVLDPANAQVRVPLRLTKRFTEKLNHDGSMERSETQEISVVNGSAKMPSFESINQIFNVHGSPTQGLAPKVEVMDEVERFLKDIPKD